MVLVAVIGVDPNHWGKRMIITRSEVPSSLYVFSSGRRVFTCNRVLEAAKTWNDPFVVARVEWALAHDRNTITLERRWRRTRGRSVARGRAVEIDIRIDYVITGMFQSVVYLRRPLGPTDPVAIKADAFLEEHFSDGAEPITGAEFEDALAIIEDMNEDFAAMSEGDVKDLNIVPYVEQLADLAPKFEAELTRPNTKMRFAELRKARVEGQRRLNVVLSAITAAYHENSPEHVEAFNGLIAPILDQNERVGARRKGPAVDVDVDPDTGEELDRDTQHERDAQTEDDELVNG